MSTARASMAIDTGAAAPSSRSLVTVLDQGAVRGARASCAGSTRLRPMVVRENCVSR
jgi:hypothetical protein